MTITNEVTCPLCGVAYEVNNKESYDKLIELLENREHEYVKDRYELAKERMGIRFNGGEDKE